MNIGSALKEIRLTRGNSQSCLAEQIGMSQTHLSLVESGKNKPSLALLERYSNHYKIPLPVLLWFSLTDTDIPENKRVLFTPIKHTIDSLIKDLFSE
jgi:transcriptional regulator with XRE-family HTH domain